MFTPIAALQYRQLLAWAQPEQLHQLYIPLSSLTWMRHTMTSPSLLSTSYNKAFCVCCGQLVVPEYSIHGLFCLMFMCAGEWVTLGLNIPLLFYHLWRYSVITSVWEASVGLVSEWLKTLFCSFIRFFHRPADGSEVMYDPVSVMNADILNYCQKESWCKLGFYLLSFFYYLYR